ncbi:hypothetical protein RG47T_1244 [Mucilaginibacter polytrichastri]|uniref:Uncharacterized protein n=1 Tax=Mucilaginibacter polytrichastri TaxID=1302689 RepID=A0A1Q5ZVR6_9SPHI|nr:hypothetical protein [Mucilaginibacter polytrichastri]OKS85798.1 hypothetical protein RG47T_1244 [Mucilaginibacter polytrichastri]
MNFKTILLLVAAFTGIAACSQDQKTAPAVVIPVAKKPVLEEPFKYHKMIEVSPGRYYDVLSWGRGANGGGAYMILRSDSTDQQYDTTTGDLEGPIQDVFNADLDIDGNPEIIIQAKSADTTRFANVFVYEYNGSKSQKLDFPRLTPSQRKGYRGEDNMYIKDSKLMRQFPIYDGSGAAAKPTGEKRLLEYSLHSNSFSVRTVSSDTTSSNSKKTIVTPAPATTQAPVVKKHSERKKTSTKKHSSEKKSSHKTETKKKHKKHHSSN